VTGLIRAHRTTDAGRRASVALRRLAVVGAIVGLIPFAAVRAAVDDESEVFQAAARMLAQRCALPACHGGPDAAQGLRLDAGYLYRETVNAPSKSDRRFRLVAPGKPDRSLLYLKLLPQADGDYKGSRMPRGMAPLDEEELEVGAGSPRFPRIAGGSPTKGNRPRLRPGRSMTRT